MKDLFKGYYRPTEKEFQDLWNNSYFVFDANILLNIYRYSKQTRSLFIKILKEFEDRIWLSHQAAYEFHERRLGVIKLQRDAYEKIDNSFQKIKKEMENNFSRHPYIKIEKITSKIEKVRKNINKELNKTKEEHPDWMERDSLLDSITALFDGKVGKDYQPDRYNEIIKEGEKRYKEKIPPGFKDDKKEGAKKYGDLILWFQIIDKAKSDSEPIIFITDDSKKDWWKEFGGNIIGPHPALINEIKSEANVDFYIYKGDRFIELAQEYLKEEVDKDAIEEIKKVREEEIISTVIPRATYTLPITGHYDGILRPQDYLTSSQTIGSWKFPHLEPGVVASSVFNPSLSLSSLSTFATSHKIGECTNCGRTDNLSQCAICGEYFCQSCLKVKIEPDKNILLCKKCFD